MDKLNYINSVSIIRQHDKLNLLEQVIKSINNSNKNIEIIVSNLIDSIVDKRQNDIKLYLKILDNLIDDKTKLANIIDLVKSIAYKTTINVKIETYKKNDKIIDYFNNKNIYLKFV